MGKKCFSAIIAAGGVGRRLNYAYKPLVKLNNREIILYSLDVLRQITAIYEIIIAVPDSKKKQMGKVISKYFATNFKKTGDVFISKPTKTGLIIKIVSAGMSRALSVYNAFKNITLDKNYISATKNDSRFVLVHDAARPFISKKLVKNLIQQAKKHNITAPAVPIYDTIKKVDSNNNILKTVKRDGIWLIQTPQVFPYSLLAKAYETNKNFSYFTDETQLFEKSDNDNQEYKLKIIKGEATNIKITDVESLKLAQIIALNWHFYT